MTTHYICTETDYVCKEPIDEYTDEEIEELCCQPRDVHPCAKKGWREEIWQGLTEDEFPEPVQDLIAEAKHNPCLEVVFADRGGLPCGIKRTEYKREGTCCDGLAPIYWRDNSYTMGVSRNEHYTVYVSGGTPPFSWSISGSGASVNGANTSGRVHIEECFCKPAKLKVTDACGEAIVKIIYLSSGTIENNVTQQPLESSEGWWQDGVIHQTGYTVMIGLSNDKTKWSFQSWRGVSAATKEAAEEAAHNGYKRLNGLAFITPSNKQGYVASENYDDIWIKDTTGLTGYSNYFHAMYPSDDYLQTKDFDHSCMDDEAVEYDWDNSIETIGKNSSGLIYWINGYAPFDVSVSGQGYWLDAEHTLTTREGIMGGAIRIYTDDTACGSGTITITDDCTGSTSGDVRSTAGEWVLILDTQQETAYNVTCIKGKVKSLDDWCTSPITNCTTVGEDICEDPNKGGAPDPVRVEGNIIHHWMCE